MSIIAGNMIGSYSQIGKTLILTDDNGVEIPGVIVSQETVFDATAEDVKIGKVFASECGVEVGKDTKTYRVVFGTRLVLPGQSFSIPIEEYGCYDYTKFHAMISKFNTTEFDSVAVDKVSLYNAVFEVNSDRKISDVTKNLATQSIDLNFTNDTDNVYIINYNTYKEE